MQQERVGDEQHDDGTTQQPPRGRGPADERRSHREGRHDLGAQHGRLEPCRAPEHDQHGDPDHEPGAQRAAPQQRTDEREHERDVLARHREQMREAGCAEVVGDRTGHAADVADQEAREQRAIGRVERLRTAQDDGTHGVGDAERRRAGIVEAHEARLREQRHRVLPALRRDRVRRAAGARRSRAPRPPRRGPATRSHRCPSRVRARERQPRAADRRRRRRSTHA